jgi:hypothetical protein
MTSLHEIEEFLNMIIIAIRGQKSLSEKKEKKKVKK